MSVHSTSYTNSIIRDISNFLGSLAKYFAAVFLWARHFGLYGIKQFSKETGKVLSKEAFNKGKNISIDWLPIKTKTKH